VAARRAITIIRIGLAVFLVDSLALARGLNFGRAIFLIKRVQHISGNKN
jgi:hypothetical protein